MTHPATRFAQEHTKIVEGYRPTFEQVAQTTATDVEKTQRSSNHLALSLPHRSSLVSPVVRVQLQSMTTDKDRDLLSSHSTRYQAVGVLPSLTALHLQTSSRPGFTSPASMVPHNGCHHVALEQAGRSAGVQPLLSTPYHAYQQDHLPQDVVRRNWKQQGKQISADKPSRPSHLCERTPSP